MYVVKLSVSSSYYSISVLYSNWAVLALYLTSDSWVVNELGFINLVALLSRELYLILMVYEGAILYGLPDIILIFYYFIIIVFIFNIFIYILNVVWIYSKLLKKLFIF